VLASCQISDESIILLGEALATNTTLVSLNLNRTRWGSGKCAFAFGKALRENKTLQKLELKSCEIGLQGAQFLADGLANNTSLIHLDLAENEDIQDAGAVALANALEYCTTLDWLDVSFCGIQRVGARALQTSLCQTRKSRLRTLRLGSWLKLSPEPNYLEPLGQVLEQNSNLTSLSFRNGNENAGEPDIRDESDSLAQGLMVNQTLTSLCFSGIAVGPQIGLSLLQCSTLVDIDLSGCDTNKEGVSAIARGLARNSTLHFLNLSSMFIRDLGAAQLGAALARNTTLQELFLVWCDIGEEGVASLAEGLVNNSVLRVLDLSSNERIPARLPQLQYQQLIGVGTGTKRQLLLYGTGLPLE